MKEAIARAGCERREAGTDGEAGFLEVGFSFSLLFISLLFSPSSFHLGGIGGGLLPFSKNGTRTDELIHFFNRWRTWRSWHRNCGWISEAGWNRRSREVGHGEQNERSDLLGGKSSPGALVSVGQHGVSLLSSCIYRPTMCDCS